MKSRPGVDWHAVHERLQRAQANLDEALDPPPERARALLDERARRLAQPPEKEPAPGEVLEVLTFTIARERYGLETRYVRDLLRFTGFTKVPGAPDVLVGLVHARGGVLAVFEIGRLLGSPGRGVTDLARLVVLGRDHDELGILADAADDVEKIRADELAPARAIAPGLGEALVRGVTRRALVVLDGAALLADERLFAGASDPERAEDTGARR